jgi:hypothetical protein
MLFGGAYATLTNGEAERECRQFQAWYRFGSELEKALPPAPQLLDPTKGFLERLVLDGGARHEDLPYESLSDLLPSAAA